ncbi:MAG: hypothetical protein ACOYMR_11130 [Ilumatobacteraceae bacterium]
MASSSGNPSAALLVIADHVERYHEQVGDLVPHYQHTDQGDMINALVEAERALRNAARLLRKAARTAQTAH